MIISYSATTRSFIIVMCFAGLSFTGCSMKGKSFVPDLENYSMDGRRSMTLDKELLEISGMCWLPDGTIGAINDEEGKIFRYNFSTDSLKEYKFGKKRDYEDIATIGQYYYVLESNGNIHRVPLAQSDFEEEFEFPREKKIEFESLYFDPRIKKLVMISKEHRESIKGVLAYAFDPVMLEFSDTPIYLIRRKDILERLKDNNAEFKPSAAAIHPKLNKVFIVASIGKALLQCSLDGKVEKAWSLNPNQFPQPEGLTFAENGDLYISNEGVDGKATILYFPYQPN